MNLYDCEEFSTKEIGLILGVVESRVSQIHASALLHLCSRLPTTGKRHESVSRLNSPEPSR
jgi:RNA polymerase sigma factor for flagellar operon FliA